MNNFNFKKPSINDMQMTLNVLQLRRSNLEKLGLGLEIQHLTIRINAIKTLIRIEQDFLKEDNNVVH